MFYKLQILKELLKIIIKYFYLRRFNSKKLIK